MYPFLLARDTSCSSCNLTDADWYAVIVGTFPPAIVDYFACSGFLQGERKFPRSVSHPLTITPPVSG